MGHRIVAVVIEAQLNQIQSFLKSSLPCIQSWLDKIGNCCLNSSYLQPHPPLSLSWPLSLDSPLARGKWMTFPSSLNMLTSSTPVTGWTLSFFNAVWSFLSSPPTADPFGLRTPLRRGVPFPPAQHKRRKWIDSKGWESVLDRDRSRCREIGRSRGRASSFATVCPLSLSYHTYRYGKRLEVWLAFLGRQPYLCKTWTCACEGRRTNRNKIWLGKREEVFFLVCHTITIIYPLTSFLPTFLLSRGWIQKFTHQSIIIMIV